MHGTAGNVSPSAASTAAWMKIPILAIVAGALLSGCAFRSPYDSGAEDSIRELELRTNEVVADGDAGRLSLAESQQFLRQSQAQMQLRAKHSHMSKEALACVDSLDREYARLLARGRPLRSGNASELQGTIFALRNLQAVRPVGRGARSTSASDDTASDPFPSDTDEAKKECESKHKRDRDDPKCRSDHR